MTITSLAGRSSARLREFRRAATERQQRVLAALIATALYALFAAIFAYPVIANIDNGIAGQAGDAYQHLWSLWWGKKALFDLGTSLSDVSMLYFPQQLEHPILGVTPWIQFVAAPLVILFNPFVAYNLGFLLATILSGLFTYFLAYEITEDHLAAFVGGLIFAFAPTRHIHGIGHYAQTMTYLFPLYFLFLVRLIRRPSLKHAVLAGITLGIASLVNFVHVAYFIIPGTVILVAYTAWKEWGRFRQPRLLGGLALAAIIGFVVTAPFYIPFLLAQSAGGFSNLDSPGVSVYGADVLAFFTPSALNPIVTNFFPALMSPFFRIAAIGFTGQNITEGLVYLGILPLLLALWGVKEKRRLAGPWVAWVVVTALLTLGPLLRVNGDFFVYEVDDRVSYLPMPYALLTGLPIYDIARTPARLNATTMLGLAVLVSLGVKSLFQRVGAGMGRRLLVIGLLTPIILLEYIAIWPYPFAIEPVPTFYERIAQEEGQFGILDYPMYLPVSWPVHSFDYPMYYQLVHERPIAGGYIWRLPPEAGGTMHALHNLIAPVPRPDVVALPDADVRVSLLDQLGFRYVVVHKFDTQFRREPMSAPELAATLEHAARLLGPAVYEDKYIVAFRVPAAASSATESLLFLTTGENWSDPEEQEGTVWRWSTGQTNGFYIYGQDDETYRLAFDADSVGGPRHITVLFNGEPLGDIVVDARRTVVTPAFSLPLPQNKITLQVAEECEVVDPDEPPGRENPCRNIRVSNVRLKAAEEMAGTFSLSPDCVFGEAIRLLGYDLAAAPWMPGDSLKLTLFWEPLGQTEQSFSVFNHLVDDDGRLLAQQDGVPVGGAHPTNWWGSGEIIADEHVISLPADLPPGADYALNTGLYEWPSGARLPIDAACPGASADQFLTLTTVKIAASP